MDKTKVLFVEDDLLLAELVSSGLKTIGYDVHFRNTLDGVVASLEEISPEVIILDIEVGDKDGISYIHKIRNVLPEVPIIVASSHIDAEIIRRAFDAGASDFIKKPYDFKELDIYVKRNMPYQEILPHSIIISSLKLNTKTHVLSNDSGWSKKLSNLEYLMLKVLSNHIGEAVSLNEIQQSLWKVSGETQDYSIRNIAKRLREILSIDDRLSLETVVGVGYMLREHINHNTFLK